MSLGYGEVFQFKVAANMRDHILINSSLCVDIPHFAFFIFTGTRTSFGQLYEKRKSGQYAEVRICDLSESIRRVSSMCRSKVVATECVGRLLVGNEQPNLLKHYRFAA